MTWKKPFRANKKQKRCMWAGIILAAIYYLGITAMFGTGGVMITCPLEGEAQCLNPFYECNKIINDCNKKQMVFCEEQPTFCNTEWMYPGQVIGEEQPKASQTMPFVVSLFIALGTIGWYKYDE